MVATTELTPEFRERINQTEMTHTAIALAIGVTKQFFSLVWSGKENVSVRFMVGAINAGLAESFDQIAQVKPQHRQAA
ncbi:hypothetical protein [Arcanobacterium haemolyticum]